ncbi:glycosyltransferase family 2 protein [Candidatus Bathyarchaeota archaeon]|nr:MAG: glycosyltransferase family 2 protein [Candidatus Bathyarchaeota archaeon]
MAETKPSVSAVIPAYFEEKTIASVVSRCLPFVDEVLVVNDGSTDDTSINARNAGARVIENSQNMGVLKTIRRGMREAKGDIIVTLDADGQHDPTEIPILIQPILDGKADLVMGARPSFPYWSEWFLTWLTSLRVPVKDAATGFRAIKQEIAAEMNVYGECTCGTFVIEAARLGARVASVPISIREREGPRRIQTRHFRQFFIVLRDVMRFW